MIVAYRPGGTVKDAVVILKHDELLPLRYNTKEATVYREAENNPKDWLLVKPRFEVLPFDSPVLSNPSMPDNETFTLTTEESSGTLYEHKDIIRLEE